MAGRLDGKAAIVTGAGSGIGRAAALLFAREDGRVTCVDLDGDAAEATAAQAVGDGGEAIAIAADVASQADTERMASATRDAFGTIDALYANAGVASSGSVHEVELAEWERVIRVHLTGVFLCARAVLPAMLERRAGSLVCQSSVSAVLGIGELAAYSAAKGGIVSLSRQMAVDYGPHGIRSNAICPGTAWTPLVARTYAARSAAEFADHDEAENRRRAARRYPLGRLGEVEEIAQLALHLASDESSWTTGAVHVVDGGMSAA